MKTLLCALLLTIGYLFPQDPPDHSDKPCLVTEVVTEGVRSDCHGWKPAKGERMFAPAEANKQLRVGDTFYFVWKETRWVAEIKTAPTNPPEVFDLVVTGIKGGVATVVGESRNPHCSPTDNQEICAHITLDIPLNSWPEQWAKAEKGVLLRARLVDGKLQPVACRSEQMRGIYDRPALNSGKRIGVDTGFDCSRPTSAFIRELLEKVN